MAISQAGMKGLSTYIASSRRDPWCTNSLSCHTKSYLQQLHQPLLVVHGADLRAKDAVEDLGNGEGERGGDQHEELGQQDGLGADCQTMS